MPAEPRHPRVCVLTTVGITVVNLFRGRMEHFIRAGFDVTVVAAPSEFDDELRSRGVTLHTVPMSRRIAPLEDWRAVRQLTRFFRANPFDLLEISTPKGALLGAIAGHRAGVPTIANLVMGLPYDEQRGLMRRLLYWTTALPCRRAHCVIAIAESLRTQIADDGLCPIEKVVVFDRGSPNGVDTRRYRPENRAAGLAVRAEHGIPPEAVVLGYIGRMVGDKGMTELLTAFRDLHARYPDLWMLMVGQYEERDRPPQWVIDTIASHPRIRHVGWRQDIPKYYGAVDLIAVPTYREGFGVVLIEAAATGVPVVASDIVGARDAMEHEVSGLKVPPKDAAALRDALDRLIGDAAYRTALGRSARVWVEAHFTQERIWSLWVDEYRRLIAGHQHAG